MRILIAPDSFKESISATAVCEVLSDVFRAHEHETVSIPIADGGEGTVAAVMAAIGGEAITCRVEGPLGQPVSAVYALIEEGQVAVIEMAAASGLQLVVPERRDPMRASTFGVGQLIRDALERGVRRIVVGLGGSATTDGGAGAAQALGVGLLRGDGTPIGRGGAGLEELSRVDLSMRNEALDRVELIAACDVTNPLVGANGSAHVYGPQKGASREQVIELDRALAHFARIVERDTGIGIAEMPGAGAAGGLCAGLVALCGAEMDSGFTTLASITNLEPAIADADCVVTGEGRYDAQSSQGKVVSGVMALANRIGKPVHLIAGVVTGADISRFKSVNVLAALAGDAAESRANPKPYLRQAAENIARLIDI